MRLDIRPPNGRAISNFRATGTIKSIVLTWDPPANPDDYVAAEIRWNTVNDLETATLYGSFVGSTTTVVVSDNLTRYFWITPINKFNRKDSVWTGPAQVAAAAITGHDLEGITLDLATITILGKLAAGNISGLGALALLGAVDLSTTQVTGALAADKIGAGQLAAGVIYGGKIYANQIIADTLALISTKLGQFSETGTGGRTVLSDSGMRVYDGSNALRVTVGKLF